MEFTHIFDQEVGFDHREVLAEIERLEWFSLPVLNIPMMQSFAIRKIISDLRMQATRVAWNGVLHSGCVFGIQTRRQALYFYDMGTHIVPIGLENLR
jgi:hypothetical protein